MVVALRQEPVVFNQLTQTSLGINALKSLPAVPELWTPASLSIFSLGNPIEIGTIRNQPLKPLPDNLRSDVTQAFEKWYRSKNQNLTLENAGLIALSLRERLRIKGSWDGFAEEMNGRSGFSDTILACVYGMIPNPSELLNELFSQEDYYQYTKLAIHTFLSNPLPPEQQLSELYSLISGKNLPLILVILEILELERPYLARSLARQIINEIPFSEYIGSMGEEKLPNLNVRVHSSFEERIARLTRLLRYMTLQDHADHPHNVTEALSESIEITNNLQAQFHAQLARNLSNNHSESKSMDDLLKVWKKAAQIVPGEPKYVVGLANALLASGRLEDARAYLEARQVDPELPLNPLLHLTAAEVAYKQDDIHSAKEAVFNALDLLEDEENFLGGDYLRLAELLSKLDCAQEAEVVLRTGYSKYPNYPELAVPLVHLQLQAGKLDEALERSYQAFALEGVSGSDFSYPSNDNKMRHLLIHSLEINGEWQSALEERIAVVEMKENPTARDYHELASCALKADELEHAINASGLAIQLNERDGIAYSLLGKALLDRGETDPALENLQKATQFSPGSTDAWINLAEAYKINGEESFFFDTLNAAAHAVPDAPEIYYSLGVAYMEQDMLTRALENFRKAVTLLSPESKELEPGNSQDYSIGEQIFIHNPELAVGLSKNTGNTLKELGYLDDARLVLGNAYRIGKKLYGLEESGIESVQIKDRRFVEIAVSLGALFMDTGEYDQAAEVLSLVVTQNGIPIQPKLDFAKSLLLADPSIEKAKRAIDILFDAFDLNPDQDFTDLTGCPDFREEEKAEAQALFAEALSISGDFENAKNVFRKALETPHSEQPHWKARMSLGLGRVALVLNEPEVALAALQEAEQLRKDPLVYKLLSQAYLDTGLINDSYVSADKYLDVSPQNSDDIGWFANHLISIAKSSDTEKKIPIVDGVKTVEDAIQNNPENRSNLILLAKLQLISGEQKKAAAALETAIEQKINLNEIEIQEVVDIVFQLKESGDTEISGRFLQHIIDQEFSKKSIESPTERSKISTLLVELSSIYESTGDVDSALLRLDQAIEIDPEKSETYTQKVLLLIETKDFEAAEPFLLRALELFPDDIPLKYAAAKLEYRLGNLYRALLYFDRIISLAINDSNISNLNDYYLQASEVAAAALLPKLALDYINNFEFKTGPEQHDFSAYCLLAELSISDGDLDFAMEIFEKAQSISPDHPRIKALKARFLALNNSLHEGLQELYGFQEETIIEDPDEKPLSGDFDRLNPHRLNRSIGEAYLELGEWDLAEKLFDNLVEQVPNEPISHLLLAKAILLRAEQQLLCRMLDVNRHAPGEHALDSGSYQDFKHRIDQVLQRIQVQDHTKSGKGPGFTLNDAVNFVRKWEARGSAIFDSSPHHLSEFLKYISTSEVDYKDAVSYLLSFGDREISLEEHSLLMEGINIAKERAELNREPLVSAMLACQISRHDSVEALDYALRAEEITTKEYYLLPWRIPMLHYIISKLALTNRQHSIALQTIHDALEEWPDEANWNVLASEIYRSDNQKIGLPDHSQAVVYLNKAIELEPEQLSFYLDLGQSYLLYGDYSSAVTVFEQAARIDPGQGEIWMSLAEAQMYAGLIEQAASSTAKAIETSDDPIKPLLLRGELDLHNNNPKGAYEIAEQLLDNLPDLLDAILMLSKALVLLERHEEALEFLRESIPKVSEPLPLELEYVELLGEIKGIDSAIPEINRIRSANPNSARVIAVLAHIQYESGQEEQAAGTAVDALTIDDDELSKEEKAKLHYLLGHHYQNEGQLDQAIHHLVYAERLNPNNVEILLELGQVYHKRRQYDEAMGYYQKAIDISPENYYPYYLSGLLLRDTKDYSGAEKAIRKASQLEPDNMDVHRMLSAVSALNLIHNKRLVVEDIPTPT